MCLAIPGKIIKIEKGSAIVDYGTEKRKAKLVEKGYFVGDYVLVQTGIVAKKIAKQEAIESIKEWNRV